MPSIPWKFKLILWIYAVLFVFAIRVRCAIRSIFSNNTDLFSHTIFQDVKHGLLGLFNTNYVIDRKKTVDFYLHEEKQRLNRLFDMSSDYTRNTNEDITKFRAYGNIDVRNTEHSLNQNIRSAQEKSFRDTTNGQRKLAKGSPKLSPAALKRMQKQLENDFDESLEPWPGINSLKLSGSKDSSTDANKEIRKHSPSILPGPKKQPPKPLHHHFHVNLTSYGEICHKNSKYSEHRIPVYYVNLADSKKRRLSYERQMKLLNFHHVHRIEAVLPSSSNIKINLKISPARENEPKEMSCLASHLVAIYTAVHDDEEADYPYALITEDDVLYELDVNFTSLALSAPENFGLLQLMTSNAGQVQEHYRLYEKSMGSESYRSYMDLNTKNPLWTRWTIEKSLWSTQAYMINKPKVKNFIDQVVTRTYNATSDTFSYTINLINPSNELFPCSKNHGSRQLDCYFPYRIVADYYLYLGCGPTFFAQIPIFNGAKVESTIHTRSSRTHANEFDEISKVIVKAKNRTDILPDFISPFQCT